ncbi:MAG: DUF58 domain-containing protein [Ruminococcus sp.]|nr:DUF58 domain-containing protein [Ruminococcus sp.]
MKFFSVMALMCLLIYIVYLIYRKNIFKGLTYECFFESDEVYEGDEVRFTEIITNNKLLPVPWLKTEFSASKNLEFSALHSVVTDKTRNVTSFFSLKSFCRIKRTWDVRCVARGRFEIERVYLSASDILGTVRENRVINAGELKRKTITVLPLRADIELTDLHMSIESGDVFVRNGIIADPFFVSGVREYSITDSMNSINWIASAKEQRLMVNKNDFTVSQNITVVLNMQSSSSNLKGALYLSSIEKCVRICAAVIQDYCANGKKVRLMSNSLRNNEMVDCTSADMHGLMTELALMSTEVGADAEVYLSCVIPKINDSEIIIISPFRTDYFDVLGYENPNVAFVFPDMDGGAVK